MFSTPDRYPSSASRWLREATRQRHDPMAVFLASLDVMIYLSGAGLLACMIALALD